MTDAERREELRRQIQLEKLAARKDIPEKRALARLAVEQLRRERWRVL